MKRLLFAVWLTAAPLFAVAAEPPAKNAELPFGEFLGRVLRQNLDLAAQRLNVPIAEAQIAVAKIFPDPAVQAGLAAIDVSGQGQPTSIYAQLTVPIEGGGKRGARIAAAQADVTVAKTQLGETLRSLRASAASAYIGALHRRLLLGQKQKTLDSLERLVRLNEQRLRVGEIGEVGLVQSRVEARQFAAEVLDAQGEVEAADQALRLLLGSDPEAALSGPLPLHGKLDLPIRLFDEATLIAAASHGRLDLLAQQQSVVSAAARIELAQANRWVDLTVSGGWTRNLATKADAFAQPTNDVLAAALSVPLPFSRIYHGELDAARLGRSQSEAQVRALELKVATDIRQALAHYRAAAARIKLYSDGLLSDADRVLAAMLYNYQRGGATLLEVLAAQRSANEVYLSYYDALWDHARGLVDLEQAAGIWDLDL